MSAFKDASYRPRTQHEAQEQTPRWVEPACKRITQFNEAAVVCLVAVLLCYALAVVREFCK